MQKFITSEWLRERVSDGYGTPNNHPFWNTVEFERVGVWKIFERDGWWYGYDTQHNAWLHFPVREEAIKHASGPAVDIWA